MVDANRNVLQEHRGEPLPWASASGAWEPCSLGETVSELSQSSLLFFFIRIRNPKKVMASNLFLVDKLSSQVLYLPITSMENCPEHLLS